MEIDTFRKWLAERGCHFDTRGHQLGEGHGHLTIHREGRTADLPLTGSRHHLDTDWVQLKLINLKVSGPAKMKLRDC